MIANIYFIHKTNALLEKFRFVIKVSVKPHHITNSHLSIKYHPEIYIIMTMASVLLSKNKYHQNNFNIGFIRLCFYSSFMRTNTPEPKAKTVFLSFFPFSYFDRIKILAKYCKVNNLAE